MKEIVFALEFKGTAAPVPGSDTHLRATTSAKSQSLRTVLTSASFESEVEIVGDAMFVEAGRIGEVTDDQLGRLYLAS